MRNALFAIVIGLFGALINGCSFGAMPDLTLKNTEIKKFDQLVGGVEVTLFPAESNNNISVVNRNNVHIKIDVVRLDRPLVVIDGDFVDKDVELKGTMEYTNGAEYQIHVKIWQSGLDLISCAFIEDMSCFQDEYFLEFRIAKE